jgi:hypothetical protein
MDDVEVEPLRGADFQISNKLDVSSSLVAYAYGRQHGVMQRPLEVWLCEQDEGKSSRALLLLSLLTCAGILQFTCQASNTSSLHIIVFWAYFLPRPTFASHTALTNCVDMEMAERGLSSSQPSVSRPLALGTAPIGLIDTAPSTNHPPQLLLT